MDTIATQSLKQQFDIWANRPIAVSEFVKGWYPSRHKSKYEATDSSKLS